MEDIFGPADKKFQNRKRDQRRNEPDIPENTSSSSMKDRDEPHRSAASRETSDADGYEKMAGIFGTPGNRFQKKNQPFNSNPSRKKPTKSVKDTPAAPPNNPPSPEIPEDDPSEDDVELSPEDLAAQYAEMAQLLGPPTGRFRRQTDEEKSPKEENPRPQGSGSRASNSHSGGKDNASMKSEDLEEEPPVMRPIENAQEEFELLRSALRGGAKSNKPRSGRRYRSTATKLEGIIMEPYRTDYNLMPIPGLRKNNAPPRKGQKPLGRELPKDYVFALGSIEQSFWALERVLDEEEEDWNREQERLRQIQVEKEEAKERRRRLRRGEPPLIKSKVDFVENQSAMIAKAGKGKKSQKKKGIFDLEVINSLEMDVADAGVRTTTTTGSGVKSTPQEKETTTKSKSARRKARTSDPGVLLLRDPKLVA